MGEVLVGRGDGRGFVGAGYVVVEMASCWEAQAGA